VSHGRRGGYSSLRDRHGSSVGGAPIGFVKTTSDTYVSKGPDGLPDGKWTIAHRYKKGYQAHHEWRVTDPSGTTFHHYTMGHYYLTLSDAVQAINEAVAIGVIGFFSNLLKWKRACDDAQACREAAQKLHEEREQAVRDVLAGNGVNMAHPIASQIVDRLFGMEA
jgi:hypothetical protein